MTEQPGTPTGDFRTRLEHLAAAAETRVQGLAAHPTHVDTDPMLLFAHILAQGTVIKLGQAATSSPALGPAEHQQQQQYKRRASAADRDQVQQVAVVDLLPGGVEPVYNLPPEPGRSGQRRPFLRKGGSVSWSREE